MDFQNKVALVTGASVGIGRAVAMRLAQGGAKLVLVDINYDQLEKVRQELSPFTEEVAVFKCDVSDEQEVCHVVKAAIEQFGKIDILVNNAALWRSFKHFQDIPTSEWEKFIAVNVMGVVYFSKAVLPQMIESRYGRIINVASVAGVYGNANMSHYSATKGAVIAMTKALAKEVVDKGVLVNSVSPGSVSNSQNPDMEFFEENDLSYMGRTGTDMENADLICFLAGDKSGYISGQNIQIDGCRRRI